MIRSIAPRVDGTVAAVSAATLGAGAALMWAVRTIASKGTSGLVEVVGVIIAPFAAWLVWARPVLFPYGLYAIIAPLDNLTQISHQEGTVARLVGLVSGAALLVFAIRTRSMRAPPRAILWLVLLCGWMALSTLWSVGEEPGKETMTLLQLAGLYLAVAVFPMQRRDMVPLLALILLSGTVAAAIGIYELHAGGVQTAQALQDSHRLDITLGRLSLDPNMYGDSLLLPFAIALVWFVRAPRRMAAVAALSVMAVLLVALALVGSRDATIGLAIETVVLTILLRSWKRVMLPAAVLTAGAIALFPNVILRAIADAGDGGSGRTSIWRVGMTAFLHHPFAGMGAGSYRLVYDQWYMKVFERYDLGWDMASHNIIIHYGVELGLIGLVLVAGWCISQWLLARSLPKIGLIGDVRAICLASLAALLFAAFFIDLFDAKFFWLVFGLVAQARNVALYREAG